jgi:hypothetical protein
MDFPPSKSICPAQYINNRYIVVNMAQDVMILLGENPFRGPLEGEGPKKRDSLCPDMAMSEASVIWAQKTNGNAKSLYLKVTWKRTLWRLFIFQAPSPSRFLSQGWSSSFVGSELVLKYGLQYNPTPPPPRHTILSQGGRGSFELETMPLNIHVSWSTFQENALVSSFLYGTLKSNIILNLMVSLH